MAFIDWVIVAAYAAFLTISMMIFVKKRIGTMSDFLVAGRGMGFYLGIAGITTAEIGLTTVMALAETGYRGGFSALVLGICFSIGVTFIGLTGFIISKLRQYKILTIPEFYGLRYGKNFRWFGGLILGVAGILNFGIFLRVDSMFFAGISGVTDPATIKIIMSVLIILALSYTLLAGMVSVLFVNFFQFLVLMLAFFATTVFVFYNTSWSNMVAVTAATYGESGFNPFAGQNMGWSYLILNTLIFLTVPCLWQPAASLGLSTRDIRVGKRMYLWSGLTFMGRGTIPILWGIAALAYFSKNAAASLPGFSPIMAMPLLMNKILPAGIKGLFVAGMFAAAMSTYNSYMLAWGGLLNQNVVTPALRLREKGSLTANRLLIVLIGAFLVWWGLFYTPPESFFQYQQLTGTVYLSGALATIFLGLYWKKANTAAAYVTVVVGGLFPLVNVLFRDSIQAWPTCFHFLLNGWKAGIFAFFLAFFSMIVVSYLSSPWCKPMVLPPTLEK
jgi:solute:Na+ symporter, SSS family